MDITGVKGLPEKRKFTIKLSTTRESVKFHTDNGKTISGMLSLPIRQADKTITLSIHEKGDKKFDYGTIEIDVDNLLKTNEFPIMNKSIPLLKTDDTAGARVSCNISTSMDTSTKPSMVGLFHIASRKAKERGDRIGKKLKTNPVNMGYLERIRFVARALDGPVYRAGVGGIEKLVWARMAEVANGKFELHLWSWKAVQGMPLLDGPADGEAPEHIFPALQVGAIVRSKDFEDLFSIKAVERVKESKFIRMINKAKGEKEVEQGAGKEEGLKEDNIVGKATVLEFRKADMPRDYWVDGLYDFLHRLRAYKKAKRDNNSEELEVLYELECKALKEKLAKSPVYIPKDGDAIPLSQQAIQEEKKAKQAMEEKVRARRQAAADDDIDYGMDSSDDLDTDSEETKPLRGRGGKKK